MTWPSPVQQFGLAILLALLALLALVRACAIGVSFGG
jgi:hypothetical protein